MNKLEKVDADVRRKVVSVTPEEDGWSVELECGHKSFWIMCPPLNDGYCSQCLDVLIARLKQS